MFQKQVVHSKFAILALLLTVIAIFLLLFSLIAIKSLDTKSYTPQKNDIRPLFVLPLVVFFVAVFLGIFSAFIENNDFFAVSLFSRLALCLSLLCLVIMCVIYLSAPSYSSVYKIPKPEASANLPIADIGGDIEVEMFKESRFSISFFNAESSSCYDVGALVNIACRDDLVFSEFLTVPVPISIGESDFIHFIVKTNASLGDYACKFQIFCDDELIEERPVFIEVV